MLSPRERTRVARQVLEIHAPVVPLFAPEGVGRPHD